MYYVRYQDSGCRRRACPRPASAHPEAGRQQRRLVPVLPQATCCVLVCGKSLENTRLKFDEVWLDLSSILRNLVSYGSTAGSKINCRFSAACRRVCRSLVSTPECLERAHDHAKYEIGFNVCWSQTPRLPKVTLKRASHVRLLPQAQRNVACAPLFGGSFLKIHAAPTGVSHAAMTCIGRGAEFPDETRQGSRPFRKSICPRNQTFDLVWTRLTSPVSPGKAILRESALRDSGTTTEFCFS